MNILLVEDDAIAAKMVKRMVGVYCQKAHIDHAEDGSSALTYVKKNTYDFVYMDYGLPDMTGTEVAGLIRENGFNMPILILSGNLASITQKELTAGGIDFAFNKPLNEDKWNETMRVVEKKKSN